LKSIPDSVQKNVRGKVRLKPRNGCP